MRLRRGSRGGRPSPRCVGGRRFAGAADDAAVGQGRTVALCSTERVPLRFHGRTKWVLRGGGGAFEGKGPQRRPQKRLGRRLEEVAKAVGSGYCRLQMPLRLALGVRGTVAGHPLGALEGRWVQPPRCVPQGRGVWCLNKRIYVKHLQKCSSRGHGPIPCPEQRPRPCLSPSELRGAAASARNLI